MIIRYSETILIIICCFFIGVVLPLKLKDEAINLSEEALIEKQITDLAYKIQTEKRVEINDFYHVNATVEAYSDGVLISFSEIVNVLERDGEYRFTENYVRIIYGGKVRCLRIA